MTEEIVWDKEKLSELRSKGYTCYIPMPITEFYRLLVEIDGKKISPNHLLLLERKGNA